MRVNDADSGLMADDLRAVFSVETEPDALMLPKCESIEQLKQVCELKIYTVILREYVKVVATPIM